MTKEIRSPNVERDAGVRAGFRHSDIPSEFAIRHSDLGTAVPGEPPFLLRTHWDHEPEPADSGTAVPAVFRVSRPRRIPRRGPRQQARCLAHSMLVSQIAFSSQAR